MYGFTTFVSAWGGGGAHLCSQCWNKYTSSATWNVCALDGVTWTDSPVLEVDVELSVLGKNIVQLVDVVVARGVQ
jgi:hypothetical protein